MRARLSRTGVLMAVIAAAPGVISLCSCGDTDTTSSNGFDGAGQGGDNGGGAGGRAPSGGNGAGAGGSGTFAEGVGGTGACVGLECQQVVCSGGGKTTVSGTVYEPAGTVGLYNVVVYVPNQPVDPIVDGASCDRCDATLSGSPVATALTDTHGRFVLENVPVGADIPLVVQVGKWRRELVLPRVDECVDNPYTDIHIAAEDSTGTSFPRGCTSGALTPQEKALLFILFDLSSCVTPDDEPPVVPIPQ